MKLIVEGRVDTSGKVALDNGMFNACVMIGDQVVGQAQVSADGEYKVEFKAEGMPETLGMKILPCSVKSEVAGRMALTITPSMCRLSDEIKMSDIKGGIILIV